MLFLQVLLFPRTHSSSRCTLDDKRTAAEADFTGQTFHFAGAEKCSRPWKMALKIFQEGKVSFSPHHKSNFWMAKIADALSPPLSARRNSRSRSRSQARQNMGFLWRCVEVKQQPRFGLSKVESSKSASKKYANEMRAENSVGTGH